MRDTIFSRGRIAVVAGCIAVAALLVAGCGGGGSTTSAGASGASGVSGSAPLSKEEFVSQANALCKQGNEQIQALQAPSQNATLSDVVPFLTQGLNIAREFDTKLEALTPPQELQSERDKLVANSKRELALAEKTVAAAKANDTSQFQALSQQIDSLDKQDDAISRSIGLTECAKHVSPQG